MSVAKATAPIVAVDIGGGGSTVEDVRRPYYVL